MLSLRAVAGQTCSGAISMEIFMVPLSGQCTDRNVTASLIAEESAVLILAIPKRLIGILVKSF